MLKFMRRSRPTIAGRAGSLEIRDLMEYPQLQAVMGPQHAIDTTAQTRFVLRRAKPQALFGVDVRLVERAG